MYMPVVTFAGLCVEGRTRKGLARCCLDEHKKVQEHTVSIPLSGKRVCMSYEGEGEGGGIHSGRTYVVSGIPHSRRTLTCQVGRKGSGKYFPPVTYR